MARLMRFCQFTTFYPPYSFGGDAMYVYRLANSLAEHGHEVDVIHCADSYRLLAGKPAGPSLPHHPDVTVHTLHSRLGPLSPILSQQTGRPWLKTKKIRQILDSKKFDVIHYHITSLFGPQVLRISPNYTGFLKLYTAHEYWLICPMHVLWKNGDRPCDRPQCFQCTLRSRRPPQWWRYTRLLRISVEDIDVFISPSRFSIDIHQQRGFRKRFVLLPHFAPESDSEPGMGTHDVHYRPFFLFVGRLEKIKGLQSVIPLLRGYKEADLLVAGSGSYEPELRHLAQEVENIKFLGWLPSSRLAALYRNAIALIVPSICYEIFPLVLFEAFANRIPAIVNAIGSLPEIIEECGGGLTYRSREELLTAMEKCRTDQEERRRLADNAHRKWRESWTEQAHIRLYFDIINEAARRKLGNVLWPESKNCGTF